MSAVAEHSSFDHREERWMARVLALARQGEAQTSPNPMVGAVLVKDDRVVGEGCHLYDGLDHAEILALRAAGEAARGATLYVNLEPCCHRGRTEPCVPAIIAAGVRRVVVAMKDPNPAVAGRGITKLRAAGIEVVTGLHEIEAQHLNENFARWIASGRPFVTLKSALTLDGCISLPARRGEKRERWITSETARGEVQRMRHATDAVLTGIGTVLADDPLLTDRSGQPRRRKLLRVVLDSRLRLPLRSKLVASARDDVLVFTRLPGESNKARALRRAGVEVVQIGGRGDRLDIRTVLERLAKREILGLLIEAGSHVNAAALAAGIVDKLFLFYAPRVAGEGGAPMIASGGIASRAGTVIKELNLYRFGPDLAVEGYLRDVYRDR
jgi:diaminohydroxyphosphoribosylaminopyrimidine deaminase/5-amino-6-(5-phosphoribosylamino)uracil reductase